MSYGTDEYDEDDYARWDGDTPDCWSYHLTLHKDRKGNVYVHELVLEGYFGGKYGSFGYPDIPTHSITFGLQHCRRPLRRRLKKLADRLPPNGEQDVTYLASIGGRHIVAAWRPARRHPIYRKSFLEGLILAWRTA